MNSEKFIDSTVKVTRNHKLIFICHPYPDFALLLCYEKFSLSQMLTFSIIELPALARHESLDSKSVSKPFLLQVGDLLLI